MPPLVRPAWQSGDACAIVVARAKRGGRSTIITPSEEAAEAPGADDKGALSVPWRRVAGILAVIATSAITALVIVSTVTGADALSTVALAIAVLAFGSELIVALAQGQATIEQLHESQRVNVETRTLLAEVRSTTQGVLEIQRSQFDIVLRHALREALPAVVAEGGPTPDEVESGEFGLRLRDKATESVDRLLDHPDRVALALEQTSRDGQQPELREGDRVVHKRWGAGVVRSVHGTGDVAVAEIEFETVGRKRVLLAWAPIAIERPPPQEV